MTLRHRQFESETCKPLIHPEHWVDLPKPKLLDEMYDRSDLSIPTLMDGEPVFDTNIIKSGYDFLYLVSNTGNKKNKIFYKIILEITLLKIHSTQGRKCLCLYSY